MILELKGVHGYYDKSHILNGVDLAVAQGTSVCLLGRNGVGKSTTMKTIMGMLNPKEHCKTEGSIKFGPPYLPHPVHGRKPAGSRQDGGGRQQ